MRQLEITREKGYYGIFRSLEILVDGIIKARLKQGESVTLNITDEARFIGGKMDWAFTEEVAIRSIPDSHSLVFQGYFTFNLFRNLGVNELPIKVFTRPSSEL